MMNCKGRKIQRSLFSLKGWNKIAQGNALSFAATMGPSPERAKQMRDQSNVMPFQGEKHAHRGITQGVALGCLVLPLRGVKADNPLRRHDFDRFNCSAQRQQLVERTP